MHPMPYPGMLSFYLDFKVRVSVNAVKSKLAQGL